MIRADTVAPRTGAAGPAARVALIASAATPSAATAAPPAIHRRRGYDGKKAKLGDLTLDETCAKCTKLEAELKAKPGDCWKKRTLNIAR